MKSNPHRLNSQPIWGRQGECPINHHYTPENQRLELAKEHHLPNLHYCVQNVNLQGCSAVTIIRVFKIKQKKCIQMSYQCIQEPGASGTISITGFPYLPSFHSWGKPLGAWVGSSAMMIGYKINNPLVIVFVPKIPGGPLPNGLSLTHSMAEIHGGVILTTYKSWDNGL